MAELMQKIRCVALAALAIITIPAAAACGGRQNIVQSGIEITQPAAEDYSAESVAKMKTAVFNLLCKVVKSAGGITELPEAAKNTLLSYAEGASKAAEGAYLTSAQFSRLADLLSSEEALALAENITLNSFARLYGKIAAVTGFDGAGSLTYNIVLYYYDALYSLNMDRYEEHGYSYLLLRAQQISAEKRDFEQFVGKQNFVLALRTACALGALADGGLDEGLASLLTDGEIVTLVSAQRLTSLSLDSRGWQTLFSLAQRVSEGSFFSKMLECAAESGDIALLSEKMNGVMSLMRSVQSRFSAEQAAHLRRGEISALAFSVFSNFSAEDWSVFEDATSLKLRGDYSALAAENFADYSEYEEGIVPRTLEELKGAHSGNFISVLEGYVGGICPVAAFLIFYDRA